MKRSIQNLSIMTLLSLAAAGCTDKQDPVDDEVGDTDEESGESSSGESSSGESSSGESSTETETAESSTSEESTESSTAEESTESSTSEESADSADSSTSEESTESTEESSSSSEEESSEADTILDTEEGDFIVDTEEEGFDTFFIPPSDMGPFSECDPFLQDCPDGDKCSPYASMGGSWDANKCVPILGDGQPGDACQIDSIVEAIDDCDGSSYCFIDTCVAFCEGTEINPICPPGTSCQISNQGSLTLCTPICDPLLQDCGPGDGCYFVNDGFACVPSTADIPLGDPCGFINDCAPGLMCVTADSLPDCAGPSCCAAFCDLQGPPDQCGILPGTSCQPVGDGFDPVGVCVL
ncbi:MAG: hypothetical protein HC927_13360 [Deltaproteobacteria bacterium]|nr:hypothetical protein [Deltaproteobacteria bacterium]